MATSPNRPRAEVPQRFRWNAESVYPDIVAWNAEYQTLYEAFELQRIRLPEHIESGTQLFDVLETAFSWHNRAKIVYLYAAMEHSVDTTRAEAVERTSQARSLLAKAQSHLAALNPLLLTIDQDTVHTWLAQDTPLQSYRHFIEDVFRKQAHTRSLELETILGHLKDPFAGTAATFRMLTNADFRFNPAVNRQGEEIDLTQGTWPRLLSDPDRNVRRMAWENYLDLYLAHQNTLASSLETSIKQNVFLAHTHNYESSLEAALFEFQIPATIFHNLLKTFQTNLPLWHRYWHIRRKALGVDPLEAYDTWAPLTPYQPQVAYDQAVEWICAGLEPMGKDYTAAIRRGCSEARWVDVYPNQGKRGGAFSSGVHGTHPFIVMSYNDTLFSLSTLAHELGHSMHSYLAWQNQPLVYSDYSLFVAEVASNFHQAMVRAYLLERFDDPIFRIAVIEEAMANFYRYFLIMPTLARLELESHQRIENGQGLTAQSLNGLCVRYFAEAYGPEMQMDPDRVGIIWATFGHLYVDYYVFQYATGIAGAYAIAQRILSGEEGAVEDYLEFLKLGGSCYPIEALKVAGVDLTSTEPVQAAFNGMEQLLDELEIMLQKV
jgi:oligoendopeptidase F